MKMCNHSRWKFGGWLCLLGGGRGGVCVWGGVVPASSLGPRVYELNQAWNAARQRSEDLSAQIKAQQGKNLKREGGRNICFPED